MSECSDKVGTNSWNGTRRLSIRNWARWLRHHSPAWISSLILHAVIFLLVLWWGVVPLVPGQGAVGVWLVGGVPGGGGASGSGPVGQGRSLGERVASGTRASEVRSRQGRAPADWSASPRARRKDSSHESPRKDVTKPPEPIATVREQPETATQEPTTASAPRSSVVIEPHPAQMELDRPTSPIPSLLAKAVSTVVPRVPFQEISGGESPNPSTPAEERGRLEGSTGKVSTGAESEKRGDGLPAGEHRPESGVGGRGDSGSDPGEGDGKGFRGMIEGGSWMGRGKGIGRGGGDWRVLLLQRIEGAKRYPARARRLRIEGIAEVQFRIAGDGTVEGVTVVKSSGFPVLDQASVETIKRAAPFPPIRGTIRVPISYRLRDAR